MSDTEIINFDEESKLRDSAVKSHSKEHKGILGKLKIPALVDIHTSQTPGEDASESKNKFKQQLDEVVSDALNAIESIKLDDFSRDPDFLEPQIKEAESKVDEVCKDLWIKLELEEYEDPADYYEMIKTAKSIFS